MKRIGIFGGSFNPVHCGHLALAKAVRRRARLDEVWLMVSPQNPLKQQSQLLTDELRLQMAQQAVANEPYIVASDYEMHLPRPSYTYDTLTALRHDYPDHRFALIIGGDNWAVFRQWRRWQDILTMCDIWIYPRPGYDVATPLPPRVHLLQATLMGVSSTDIRRRVAAGESIEGLVPPAIEPRVRELYANGASL